MLSTIKPSRQDTTPFRSLFWVVGASEWPRTCYVGIHSRLLSPNDLRVSTFPLFRSQASRHHAQVFILMCSKVIQFLCMQDKYFTNGKISTGLGEVGEWDRVWMPGAFNVCSHCRDQKRISPFMVCHCVLSLEIVPLSEP